MNKKKMNVFGRAKRTWVEMKFWNSEELCKADWLVALGIMFVLFVSCVQGDIRMTGNRSFLMYEHFTDFYEASYQQSGGYWANYLPSTFLAYALWNLPLYLTGHVPEQILTNSIINNLWFKLLPVILYFVTSHLIYRIALRIGFEEKKARLCRFAFLIFPISVYSQFLFGQYDIFTVFFMILGLYYYLNGKMWRFSLFFGIAVTFKYQALLYFLVFVLLREKKIRNLIKYAVVVALPALIEIIPNWSSPAFHRAVLGFGVLDFVDRSFYVGFFSGFNLMAVVCAFILVWSYQKKAETEAELVSWGLFFAVAISFGVFGFSSWNPQWILLLAPFLVLNIFINENGNMLVMITNIFMLAMYIFCSQSLLDETVLNLGIFKYLLKGRTFAVRMWDIYAFHNEELLLAAMWVVLLVYVVFGHPRYHKNRGNYIAKDLIWQLRSAFLFCVAAFVIPLAICLVSVLQGKIIFFDNSRTNMELDNIVMVQNDEPIVQEIIADGYELTEIKARVYTDLNSDLNSLRIVLRDKENGTVLYEKEKDTYGYSNNSSLYTLVAGPIAVEDGKVYELEIISDAPEGEGIGFYCISTNDEDEALQGTLNKNGEKAGRLQMRVTGVE